VNSPGHAYPVAMRASARAGLIGLLAVLALTACSSSEPEETSLASPNINACKGAVDLHNDWTTGEWTDRRTPAERLAFRETYRSEMDKWALEAEGDVKDRLEQLVDDMPTNIGDILLTTGADDRDAYLGTLDRLANACAAEGITINATNLKGQPRE
jgi:hypothetical protein